MSSIPQAASAALPAVAPSTPPKLLHRMRDHLRTRHYSIRTEAAYLDWARRFILFHDKRHPADMGAAEVAAFLTHLAVDRQVSASTQNQAKSAILYLYKEVLQVQLPWLDEVVQAKAPKRLPVVLTPSEVRELLMHMQGTTGLVARLLYGTGMRLLEALRLRVKDVEFSRREIVIREGKGNKDRVTVLPENLIADLQAQLQRARALHDKDLEAGFGRVYLPHALAVKYPQADRSWAWQYVFPSPVRALMAWTGTARAISSMATTASAGSAGRWSDHARCEAGRGSGRTFSLPPQAANSRAVDSASRALRG